MLNEVVSFRPLDGHTSVSRVPSSVSARPLYRYASDVCSSKGQHRLDQLYSVITTSLSIIEKNGSGLFDSVLDEE